MESQASYSGNWKALNKRMPCSMCISHTLPQTTVKRIDLKKARWEAVIARVEARDDKNLKQNSRNQKEKDGTD